MFAEARRHSLPSLFWVSLGSGARIQPRAQASTAKSSDLQTRPAPPAALAPTPPRREPRPAPRARARLLLTRPAPARGHAPAPVLLWRPAPPRVCVEEGGRPSLARTRLAGAREQALRGVSWAGRRADVARGCGQVPQPSSPPPPLLPPGFV